MSRPLRITSEPSESYALLTGATGLVGQYLMRDLLLSGTRLAVLVRPGKREKPQDRIERILQRWESELGKSLPRPVVLGGDVTQPLLGFKESECQWIRRHCDRMIHNAAILKFHATGPSDEPWQTNLRGTENALHLARHCQIQQLHYVSTAYVCGNRHETIMESDFQAGQDFRNEYERSKFEAEKLVRDCTDMDSITVYRPVVIAGDSQTGYTSTYHGLYVYLRLFAMFVPEQARDRNGKILTPVKIPLEGNEPRNVVPVDWVSDVFCEIFRNPQAHGLTYHMAPDQCLTPSQVIEACYDYFDSHGVEFCGDQIPDDHQHPDFAEKIFDNIAIYQQYESNDPQFDTTNLKRFTRHLPCPPIDAATIHRYLDFGNKDNWGKKRALKISHGNERERRA